jgi:hypothetical protein
MNKNGFAGILALTILLMACSEQKTDFVGFSFDVRPADLESQGFVCKKKGDETKCTNPDIKASVFGTQTEDVVVTFLDGEKRACCIAAKIPEKSDQLYKLEKLRDYISRVYTHMPERDLNYQFSFTRSWKRPDGTGLSLMVLKDNKGKTSSKGRFTAYSQEWEANTTANLKADAAADAETEAENNNKKDAPPEP